MQESLTKQNTKSHNAALKVTSDFIAGGGKVEYCAIRTNTVTRSTINPKLNKG